MKIVGSVVKAGEERFAVVAVQPSVLEFGSQADQYVEALSRAFDGLPVVLMTRPTAGKAKYYGRQDLVDEISTVKPNNIPWREITLDV